MLRILLVEDNRGDVLLVRQALAVHQIAHELHVMRDGEEALRFVSRMGKPGNEPCPDMLLLDLNLPRADGSEVLRSFRRHPECAGTPVIVISSSDAPAELAKVGKIGISRYFRKPIDYDAFMLLGRVILELAA